MEVLPEIITGVEGKFGRSGASAHLLPWRIRKRQSPLIAKGGAAGEHDLNESAQKDYAVRARAWL